MELPSTDSMVNVQRKPPHYPQTTHAIDGIVPPMIACNLMLQKLRTINVLSLQLMGTPRSRNAKRHTHIAIKYTYHHIRERHFDFCQHDLCVIGPSQIDLWIFQNTTDSQRKKNNNTSKGFLSLFLLEASKAFFITRKKKTLVSSCLHQQSIF